MTISEYLRKSSAYTAKTWLSEMEALMKAPSPEHFPFTQEKPMPENTNLITGSRRYDLNAQRLDLHAASAGVDRTLWIFAADAEILNLHVREDQKPLPVFSNIAEPGKEAFLEAHQAYFIDQFTPESLSRLPAYASPESIQHDDLENSRRRHMFAKMAVLHIADYDTGIRDRHDRLAAVKNIRENSNPKSAAFQGAGNTYRHYVRTGSDGVFNALRKYYIRQVSGNPLNSHETPPSPSAFLSNIPAAVKTMFNARIFVKRLENQDFFLDYSRSNPPKAAFIQTGRTEKKISPSLPSPFPERARR
jgi:hypothetical protein